MHTWWQMSLGDPMLADAELDRLTHAARQARSESAQASEYALFLRHESQGHVHCELIVYFSPAAETEARAFGAQACARPAPGDISVLVGSDDAVTRLLQP